MQDNKKKTRNKTFQKNERERRRKKKRRKKKRTMGWVEMRRGAEKVADATLEAYICKT